VIDLHSHVLPGIDDGPESLAGSIALARAAHAAGTRTLIATPHVSWRYPNHAGTIRRLVDELNGHLREEDVPLVVRRGSEIAVSRLLDIDPQELSVLGLGGGPWLLLEPPFGQAVTGLEMLTLQLQSRGHQIVLAHPERCSAFHRDRAILESLVQAGALTSVTAGSLVGRFGERVRRFALALVRDGMVHNVASDAHDETGRPPGIARELEQAGLGSLRDWLTSRVPAAILDGTEIPERPLEDRAADSISPLAQRRRSRWRRR
jgi:protein-tyrosine phosphatase